MAGIYGAVHDQISYSVAFEYFTEFKFKQFAIPETQHNRLGVAIVGWKASWWMGLIIGIPVYLASLFMRGTKNFIALYLNAALLVVGITLAVGLAALATGFFIYSPETLPLWMARFDVTDPVAFARVGNMHNFSYLGGALGLLSGCIYCIMRCFKMRGDRPKN